MDLKFLSAKNWALLREKFLHLLWSRVWDWSKQKVKIIVLQIIRSFIHPTLGITYRFRLDASENRLWYTNIKLFLPFLYESGMISIIIIMSECFYRIKVSVLYKFIQVKNCYQHLSCVKPLSKKGGKIFKEKMNNKT